MCLILIYLLELSIFRTINENMVYETKEEINKVIRKSDTQMK